MRCNTYEKKKRNVTKQFAFNFLKSKQSGGIINKILPRHFKISRCEKRGRGGKIGNCLFRSRGNEIEGGKLAPFNSTLNYWRVFR